LGLERPRSAHDQMRRVFWAIRDGDEAGAAAAMRDVVG
jgi:DNA-binding GntR family transcriptional regulator